MRGSEADARTFYGRGSSMIISASGHSVSNVSDKRQVMESATTAY